MGANVMLKRLHFFCGKIVAMKETFLHKSTGYKNPIASKGQPLRGICSSFSIEYDDFLWKGPPSARGLVIIRVLQQRIDTDGNW
jgi:hypothetical protein